MAERIVIALGGNAILTDDPTAQAQMKALDATCDYIVPLIAAGDEVIITHGNGPQVGNLLLQQEAANSEKNPAMPLDTCVAMTQGSIGYWTMLAMRGALKRAGIKKLVQVLAMTATVSPDDPAFKNPTKPIGPFYSEEQARELMAANPNETYIEDAGRGWRRVVPSPEPMELPGCAGINALADAGIVVICTGGGGIPVLEDDKGVYGVEGVIDKDLTAEKIAETVNADHLVICTGVDNVCVDFGKPTQRALSTISIAEAEQYIEEGQFPAGSMLPKVRGCMRFVQSGEGRRATITSLECLAKLNEGAGTTIVR